MTEVGQWAVFPRGDAGGNPCPVVLDARRLTPVQMLAVAAHYGHESAFVVGHDAGRVALRFFVPRHEMRMCVHATIAAVTALAGSGALTGGQAAVSTASGEHRVSWEADGVPVVTVDQHPPVFGPAAAVHREAAAALRLPGDAIAMDAVIRPVSVSRPKLIVPASDADAVHGARPDFPALWRLCRRLDCTGAYVFAPHPDRAAGHVVARQFPVDAGYPEDPATGVAAAALAAYLATGRRRPQRPAWSRIVIDQGDAMGHPATLHAAALTGPAGVVRTSVTGRAIRTGTGRIDLHAVCGQANLPEPELR